MVRPSDCTDLTTENNRTPIVDGIRLFNYYDRKWGVVSDIGADGWFTLNHEDGTRATLNGARVSTRETGSAAVSVAVFVAIVAAALIAGIGLGRTHAAPTVRVVRILAPVTSTTRPAPVPTVRHTLAANRAALTALCASRGQGITFMVDARGDMSADCVATTLSAQLGTCRAAGLTCHIETDVDGSRSVYGRRPVVHAAPVPSDPYGRTRAPMTAAPVVPSPAPVVHVAPVVAPVPAGTVTYANNGPRHITEDSSGYRCAVDGNGICGPVTIDTVARVVHTVNGTFPYTSSHVVDTYDGTRDHLCVTGRYPNGRGYGPLACAGRD